MKKIATALMFAALVLSACSKPASVGAGSEEKTSAAVSGKMSWTEKISGGHAAKAQVSFSATGLIVDALFSPDEMTTIGKLRTLPATVAYVTKRKDREHMIEILDLMSIGKAREGLWGYAKGLDEYAGILKLGDAEKAKQISELNPTQRAVMDTLSQGKTAEAERLIQLQLARIPVSVVLNGFVGWEVAPETKDFFTNRPLPDNARKLHAYLTYMEASADYSSRVLADIASKVSSQIWANPDVAKAEIRRVWYAQDPNKLNDLWATAVANAEKSQRIINLSSTQRGVDWLVGDTSYSGTTTGLAFSKNGQAWFGDGTLEGKKYMVGLESSYSKGSEESSGGDISTRANVGTSASGNASPK